MITNDILCTPGRKQAEAFLAQDVLRHLPMLGALIYEPIEELRGVERAGELVALALVVAGEANIPDALPTVMLDAVDQNGLHVLLNQPHWPHATWSVQNSEWLAPIEQTLGRRHDPHGGTRYFLSESPPPTQQLQARRITAQDSQLDLSPCNLSHVALSFWLIRGYRVFGVVAAGQLLGHAVVSYPIANTEEVAAVFTAPFARGQGIAQACAAASINDILSHGKQPIYVSRKNNHASIAVARALGMQPITETWEV